MSKSNADQSSSTHSSVSQRPSKAVRPPIHDAVLKGFQFLQEFINRSKNTAAFNIEERDLSQMSQPTPLMVAISRFDLNSVKLLIQNNANPNTEDTGHHSIFYSAVSYAARAKTLAPKTRQAALDIVEYLLSLKNIEISSTNPAQHTPLMYAAYCGDDEIINLIKRHPDKKCNVEARFILPNKPKDNATGNTAFLIAAFKGHIKAMQALQSMGANVNATNANKLNAMDLNNLRAATGDKEKDEKLKSDVFNYLKSVMTPMSSAVSSGMNSHSINIAAASSATPIKINYIHHIKPLFDAAQKGRIELDKYIKENQHQPWFDLNRTNANLGDKTVLIYLAELGDIDSIFYLLNKAANLNKQDHLGNTALHQAITCAGKLKDAKTEDEKQRRAKYVAIVKLLVVQEISLDITNRAELSPFYLASKLEDKEITDIIGNKLFQQYYRNNSAVSTPKPILQKGGTGVGITPPGTPTPSQPGLATPTKSPKKVVQFVEDNPVRYYDKQGLGKTVLSESTLPMKSACSPISPVSDKEDGESASIALPLSPVSIKKKRKATLLSSSDIPLDDKGKKSDNGNKPKTANSSSTKTKTTIDLLSDSDDSPEKTAAANSPSSSTKESGEKASENSDAATKKSPDAPRQRKIPRKQLAVDVAAVDSKSLSSEPESASSTASSPVAPISTNFSLDSSATIVVEPAATPKASPPPSPMPVISSIPPILLPRASLVSMQLTLPVPTTASASAAASATAPAPRVPNSPPRSSSSSGYRAETEFDKLREKNDVTLQDLMKLSMDTKKQLIDDFLAKIAEIENTSENLHQSIKALTKENATLESELDQAYYQQYCGKKEDLDKQNAEIERLKREDADAAATEAELLRFAMEDSEPTPNANLNQNPNGNANGNANGSMRDDEDDEDMPLSKRVGTHKKS